MAKRIGVRASAIIIKDNKILLIHRKKEGKEYWVFPGGGIEEGDTAENTVLREVEEETSLKATNPRLEFEAKTFEDGNIHPFFLVDVEDGLPKLSGPEAERHSSADWYHPERVDLKDIPKINLVPEGVKRKLLDFLD